MTTTKRQKETVKTLLERYSNDYCLVSLDNTYWTKFLFKWGKSDFAITRNEQFMAFIRIIYRSNTTTLEYDNIKNIQFINTWYIGDLIKRLYNQTLTSYDKYKKTFLARLAKQPYNKEQMKYYLLQRKIEEWDCQLNHNFSYDTIENNDGETKPLKNIFKTDTQRVFVTQEVSRLLMAYLYPIIDYIVEEVMNKKSLKDVQQGVEKWVKNENFS